MVFEPTRRKSEYRTGSLGSVLRPQTITENDTISVRLTFPVKIPLVTVTLRGVRRFRVKKGRGQRRNRRNK